MLHPYHKRRFRYKLRLRRCKEQLPGGAACDGGIQVLDELTWPSGGPSEAVILRDILVQFLLTKINI